MYQIKQNMALTGTRLHLQLSREKLWRRILPSFDLPLHCETPVSTFYQHLLAQFEDIYRKKLRAQGEPNRTIDSPQTIVLSSGVSPGALSSSLPPLLQDSTSPSEDPTLSNQRLPASRDSSKVRFQTALFVWFSNLSFQSESGDCGGRICIKVEDDFTHPLGFKGHRIIIRIEHDINELRD